MDMKTHDDETMAGVEETMSTTPTGSHGQGFSSTSQATDSYSSNSAFSPNPDYDHNARYTSAPQQQQPPQQPPMQPYPRPSSGLSGSGHPGYAQNYQDQSQRQGAQSSVVIKVGMVGDAQIGKTSLMVKYVEGSWDEDYIQTLGQTVSERRCGHVC